MRLQLKIQNKSNVNKYANQCTNKKRFSDPSLLSVKTNRQLKENLRGWHSQMRSRSVDQGIKKRDNNSNVN